MEFYTSRFDNEQGCKVYTFEQVINCNARPQPKNHNDEVQVENKADEGTTEEEAPKVPIDIDSEESVDAAKWSRAFIDSLPNSSFAVVEKGYKDGDNKKARHLPFKDSDGKIDVPHLQNAWDRRDQIESVLKTESNQELRDRAEKALEGPYKEYVTKGKEPDKKEDTKDNQQDVRVNNSGLQVEPIRQNWRLISAVQAWPSSDFWQPQMVDYGYEGGKALKGIISLVNKNKPDLLWNHSHDAHDVAGYVDNANWENSSDIPPGVNADLVVDPAFDYKAAMGLKNGFLRSGSIGVTMDCKPSHESMSFEKFVDSQGEKVDGDIVRWIPVKIQSVRHMAILPTGTGADPNAGTRVSPNNQRNKDMTEDNNTPQTEATKTQGDKNMTDEKLALLAMIAKRLGVEVALSEEAKLPEGLNGTLIGKIDAMSDVREKYNILCAKADAVVAKLGCDSIDAAMPVLDSKLDLAKCGEKLLDHFRKEAIKWFDSSRAVVGRTEASESDKRVRARIEASEDLDYLEDVALEYRGITENGLSSTRTSQGVDVTEEPKAVEEVDQRAADIAASVKRLFNR